MNRGAIYLATGEKYIAEARASAASLARYGFEHSIIEQEGLARGAHGGKTLMFRQTPYESTVFLVPTRSCWGIRRSDSRWPRGTASR